MRRFFQVFSFILLSLTAQTSAVFAEDVLPERRLIATRNMDFYGADLQVVFDTTYEACQAICLNNQGCAAFTFNSNKGACFPKTGVSEQKPFEGALSGIVVRTGAAVRREAAARAQALDMLRESDFAAALRQARDLGVRHPGGAWSVDVLADTVERRWSEGKEADAIHWQGAATAQSDAPEDWAHFADLMLRIQPAKKSTARSYRGRAVSAALNAYLRSLNPDTEAQALRLLGRALEETGRGKEMVPVLRMAEARAPSSEGAAALERAVRLYGFRIAEHKVESDSADPRICAEFTEELARTGVDYAPYVQRPDPRMSVSAEGRKLCVDGVTHGERVRVTFRAGLPAANGESLAKDVTLTQYVRDRAASVRFAGRAYVLPRGESASLPVETINLTELNLTLRRVSERNLGRALASDYFAHPLSYWKQVDLDRNIAETVWTGTGTTRMELNKEVTTRLPLGEMVPEAEPGIYALTAAVPGKDRYDDPGATQWFLISDLGITTMNGTDGLHVLLRGLGDAAPRAGVEVSLISRSNRVLGTAMTDPEGRALFAPGLLRGTKAAAPALVVAKEKSDMAFLSLTDPAFDLSDRGVEGRPPAPPIDVYATTDRGAYRAGETVHVTALARDEAQRAIGDLPLTARLTRPDGVRYAEAQAESAAAGGHVYRFALGDTVPHGTWRLAILADPDAAPLTETAFLVEDFLPERIDFDLTLPEGTLGPDLPPLEVAARYLFGAPGADLPIDALLRVSTTRTLDEWAGYRFGRYDAGSDRRSLPLGSGMRTDAAGQATLPLTLPEIAAEGRPLVGTLEVQIAEGSGRPVERSITRTLAPQGPVIGIKPLFDAAVPEGAEARFEVIALDATLSPTDMPVRWTLNRVERSYQWFQMYGNWEWEPVTQRTRIATGEAVLGADPLAISAPVEWGRYELVVEREGGDYVAAAEEFTAGWWTPSTERDTPDLLELSLDKERYAPGDTATLRIVPRFAGTALVSVLSNRVIAMKAVEVGEGATEITLPVTEEWGTGAYVTAQVIRPVGAENGPTRVLGLSHAAIAPADRALDVALDLPAEAQPRQMLNARLTATGGRAGETVYATVAAVDLGILNLTGFDAPDPQGHYFGQRRLGVELRDLYGRLIDPGTGALGTVRSGGDGASGMQRKSPPPTQELVHLFSGLVTLDAEGRADVPFDVPAFNGTLRVMAVAWSDGAVGQAAQDVIVSDPVVVTASLPNFLAPGDESRLLLEMQHKRGPAGEMGLEIGAEGVDVARAALPATVTLVEGGKATLAVPVIALNPGDHPLSVTLVTPDGQRLTQQLTLPVRANDPEISRTRRLSLGAGQTFSLTADLFDGLRPGTGAALLSAGTLAEFDVPRMLDALDRYPYGCTEQLTSQGLPMLYMADVSRALGLDLDRRVSERVSQIIDQLATRQGTDGSFGLWSAGGGTLWLDTYVTDFLSQARVEGHAVPQRLLKDSLDNLRNRVAYAEDFENGGEALAYALMVLAREGTAAMSDLRYYADERGDNFRTAMAQAQLGAALASYGDQPRADAMFARAAARLRDRAREEQGIREDFGTPLRDTAAVLTLAAASGSMAVDMPRLAAEIGAATGPLSTQEMSWSLLAAHRLSGQSGLEQMRIDGIPVEGPLVRAVESADALPMEIRNDGSSETPLTLTTRGVPVDPQPAGGYGYALERSYFDLDGKPVTGPIEQGTRLVAVLTVRPSSSTGARLIIDDPLPAGLEIDNPSLLASGDVRALDWVKSVGTEATEFRSDRFVAAVDWSSADSFRLAYVLRAVTPGSYHHPAAKVEDMYRPERGAWTGAGQIIVTE